MQQQLTTAVHMLFQDSYCSIEQLGDYKLIFTVLSNEMYLYSKECIVHTFSTGLPLKISEGDCLRYFNHNGQGY